MIGGEGFGWWRDRVGLSVPPSSGRVLLAMTCASAAIARSIAGRCRRHVIGAGTMIDNLVQIAHNVRIGTIASLRVRPASRAAHHRRQCHRRRTGCHQRSSVRRIACEDRRQERRDARRRGRRNRRRLSGRSGTAMAPADAGIGAERAKGHPRDLSADRPDELVVAIEAIPASPGTQGAGSYKLHESCAGRHAGNSSESGRSPVRPPLRTGPSLGKMVTGAPAPCRRGGRTHHRRPAD